MSRFDIISRNIFTERNKNISYVFLSIYCIYCLIQRDLSDFVFYTIGVYTLMDTIFYDNGTDVLIHHFLLLILQIFHTFYGKSIDIFIYEDMKRVCMEMEISSLFLGIMHLLKDLNHPWIESYHISTINSVLFTLTFIKYRMIRYINGFVLDTSKHQYFMRYAREKMYEVVIFYIIFGGFFLLNTYWFMRIIKRFIRIAMNKEKRRIKKSE
jgi:hypothetical protein